MQKIGYRMVAVWIARHETFQHNHVAFREVKHVCAEEGGERFSVAGAVGSEVSKGSVEFNLGLDLERFVATRIVDQGRLDP